MLDAYFKQEAERQKLGIPPLPLSPDETAEVCRLLENPPAGTGQFLLALLRNRVSPGVDPSAKVKAEWLAQVAHGRSRFPRRFQNRRGLPPRARCSAATMSTRSSSSWTTGSWRRRPPEALKHIILVYGAFDRIVEKSKGNRSRQRGADVLGGRASGSSTGRAFPSTLTFKVFKVDGEINTDDFSPAKQASTRPDIPLHALSMGETRFPGGSETHPEVPRGRPPGRVRRRRRRHGLLPQIGLQFADVAHRRGHPVHPEQAPRRRRHRRADRADLLQHDRGLGRPAAHGRCRRMLKTGDIITLDTEARARSGTKRRGRCPGSSSSRRPCGTNSGPAAAST